MCASKNETKNTQLCDDRVADDDDDDDDKRVNNIVFPTVPAFNGTIRNDINKRQSGARTTKWPLMIENGEKNRQK